MFRQLPDEVTLGIVRDLVKRGTYNGYFNQELFLGISKTKVVGDVYYSRHREDLNEWIVLSAASVFIESSVPFGLYFQTQKIECAFTFNDDTSDVEFKCIVWDYYQNQEVSEDPATTIDYNFKVNDCMMIVIRSIDNDPSISQDVKECIKTILWKLCKV